MLRKYVYEEAELVSLEEFSIGWISPIGELFNLPYGCHSVVAQNIVEEIYGISWLEQKDKKIDGEDYLIAQGWAKVFQDVQEGTLRSFVNERPSNEILMLIQTLSATPSVYH